MSQTWTNQKDGSLMRLIPAGEFIMGSTLEQTEAAKHMDNAGPQFPLSHETPQFRAKIDSFYLCAFAATNEQFARFLTETKPSPQQLKRWVSWLDRIVIQPNDSYRAVSDFKLHPVINVTWFGAEAYCNWAGLRLPTGRRTTPVFRRRCASKPWRIRSRTRSRPHIDAAHSWKSAGG